MEWRAAQYAAPQQASPWSSALSTALGVGGLYQKMFHPQPMFQGISIMRTLSRPMFNMGGPIKQGIMHGIREPLSKRKNSDWNIF